MRSKTFTVEVTTWEGTTEMTFYATCANDAKKGARAEMRNRGYTRQDGPVQYRARVNTEA
jgi:hypothetical protein